MLKAAAIIIVGLPLALLAAVLTRLLRDRRRDRGRARGRPGRATHRRAGAADGRPGGAGPRPDRRRPARPRRARRPGVAPALSAAREIVVALAEAPDGELVRVRGAGHAVVVEKRGDSLHVQVHDGDDDVEVNVPLDAVLEAVPADGRIDAWHSWARCARPASRSWRTCAAARTTSRSRSGSSRRGSPPLPRCAHQPQGLLHVRSHTQ